MTDPLRILHADADAALARTAAVAYELAPDDRDVRTLHGDADGLLSRLVARGLEDLAGRAYPGSAGDGGPVSSSAVSDPTGSAGTRDLGVVVGEARDDRWIARAEAGDPDLPTATHFEGRRGARDYQTITRTVRHVVGILGEAPQTVPTAPLARASAHQAAVKTLRSVVAVLTRCEERLTPRATGEPCPMVARDDDGTVVARCQGTVTHHGTGRGLCERCDSDWRAHRGLQIPPEVLEARNARRRHACTCHDPTHDHDPGECLGQGPPGELVGKCDACRCACGPDCCPEGCADPRTAPRTVSNRCRMRQYRAGRQTTGTGGAFAWDQSA